MSQLINYTFRHVALRQEPKLHIHILNLNLLLLALILNLSSTRVWQTFRRTSSNDLSWEQTYLLIVDIPSEDRLWLRFSRCTCPERTRISEIRRWEVIKLNSQLRLRISPIWYCFSSPLMTGPACGKSGKRRKFSETCNIREWMNHVKCMLKYTVEATIKQVSIKKLFHLYGSRSWISFSFSFAFFLYLLALRWRISSSLCLMTTTTIFLAELKTFLIMFCASEHADADDSMHSWFPRSENHSDRGNRIKIQFTATNS
jgi:hypothetical protein